MSVRELSMLHGIIPALVIAVTMARHPPRGYATLSEYGRRYIGEV